VPKRNVILLVVVCLVSLAAFAAREQSAAGRRFGEVLALVESSYLDRVDGDALFETAVDAAIGRLDEHSAYLRGDGRRDLEASIDQRFGGVGLELSIDEAAGVPVVVSPVVDSPAWRSGVRAGDLVEAIDGEPTRGHALKAVVGRLRGRVGEKVVLRLASPADRAAATLDPGAADGTLVRRDAVLVREEIRTESVLGDRRRADGSWDWMLEGVPGVALVRITAFGERTADELAAAADAIEAAGGVRGVVLDLRGNPGGLLSAAVEVCDTLLDEGVIVHTRSRRDAATPAEAALDTRRATAGARFAGVPMAVLVDGLTASAAEIVAACLQDAGRATVVGSRTYGKGTVQSILPLADDRGLLKLTTSEYLRPSRATIHRRRGDGDDDAWGVSPDAGREVAVTAESRGRLQAWRRSRDAVGGGAASAAVRPLPAGLPAEIDPVLARALGVLGDAAARAAEPDLGGEKEAPRDDDEPARPDA
jgi:carboxyl-terminal processing protease